METAAGTRDRARAAEVPIINNHEAARRQAVGALERVQYTAQGVGRRGRQSRSIHVTGRSVDVDPKTGGSR